MNFLENSNLDSKTWIKSINPLSMKAFCPLLIRKQNKTNRHVSKMQDDIHSVGWRYILWLRMRIGRSRNHTNGRRTRQNYTMNYHKSCPYENKTCLCQDTWTASIITNTIIYRLVCVDFFIINLFRITYNHLFFEKKIKNKKKLFLFFFKLKKSVCRYLLIPKMI